MAARGSYAEKWLETNFRAPLCGEEAGRLLQPASTPVGARGPAPTGVPDG